MQVISIDCGRDTLKSVTGNRKVSIKSTVGEPRELKIADYCDYDVVINGQRHFVGELAERESRFRREMVSRSKIHEDTAILSLTAIAMLANEPDIRVVTGLPVALKSTAISVITNVTKIVISALGVTIFIMTAINVDLPSILRGAFFCKNKPRLGGTWFQEDVI